MHGLKIKQGEYLIDCPVPFKNNGILTDEDIFECFSFAFDMSFGQVGEHRDHRSGGQVRRRTGEIFIDTFQGKLAEYTFYNYFKEKVPGIKTPDVTKMGLSQWDSCDFSINGKEIAIKSTKHYGNLLLLETKDWDENGFYLPNRGTIHEKYDYFVLIRVKPDATAMMKDNRWLYVDSIQKMDLQTEIAFTEWEVDIVGYISREELVNEVIRKKQILPQNSMLNGNTKMDAENYYVQAGDLHDISELIELLNQ